MEIIALCRQAWNESKSLSQPDYDALIPEYRERLTLYAEAVVSSRDVSADPTFASFERRVKEILSADEVPKEPESLIEPEPPATVEPEPEPEPEFKPEPPKPPKAKRVAKRPTKKPAKKPAKKAPVKKIKKRSKK